MIKIEENSPYCELCNSCGESGCCSPSNCLYVKCKYGDYNLKEYKNIQNELNAYHAILMEVQKFLAWQGNECSTLESRKLSEKITNLMETDFSIVYHTGDEKLY